MVYNDLGRICICKTWCLPSEVSAIFQIIYDHRWECSICINFVSTAVDPIQTYLLNIQQTTRYENLATRGVWYLEMLRSYLEYGLTLPPWTHRNMHNENSLILM